MNSKKQSIIVIIMVICITISNQGCSKKLNIESIVASHNGLSISINDKGSIDVQGEADQVYNFSDWEDIKSVSVGVANAFVEISNRFKERWNGSFYNR
jgi:hypothetical protein